MVKKKGEPGDLITLQDAATLRGYKSVSGVSRLIGRGRVEVYERYGRKLVSRSEVKAYRPAKGGRPKEAAAKK